MQEFKVNRKNRASTHSVSVKLVSNSEHSLALNSDLAGPCRGPNLRDEFSLDIFTSEGTYFQLKQVLFLEKKVKR